MDTTQLAKINAPNPDLNALAILASHLADDVYAANLRKDAESSRGTRTKNSERALLGDVLLFTAWCTDAGLRFMPAAAETVAAFIDAQAAAGKAPARTWFDTVLTLPARCRPVGGNRPRWLHATVRDWS